MWIIRAAQTESWKAAYIKGIEMVAWQRSAPDEWCEDIPRTQVRDEAHRFETKKEAQDFKDKFSITGSIIPA